MQRVVGRAKGTKGEVYEKLDKMTYSVHKRRLYVSVLDRLSVVSYQSMNFFVGMLMMATTRIVQMTLEHGISEFSGTAFGCIASLS